MPNFIIINEAVNETAYSMTHIRTLLTRGAIRGRKSGGIWLVDIDDLKAYEQRMRELDKKKFTTQKNKHKSQPG